MFDSESRYYELADLTHTLPDGRKVLYKERRLVPQAGGPLETVIGQSDRLDLVAARTEGDPLRFWRICDANVELNPFMHQLNGSRVLRLPEED